MTLAVWESKWAITTSVAGIVGMVIGAVLWINSGDAAIASDLAKLTSNHEVVKEGLFHTAHKVDALEKRIDALEGNVGGLSNNVAVTTSQVSTIMDSLKQVASDLKEASNNFREITNDNTRLEEGFKSLREDVKELKGSRLN